MEFAFLVDLDNDGKAREVLPQLGNRKMPLAWYEANGGEFVRHAISDKSSLTASARAMSTRTAAPTS